MDIDGMDNSAPEIPGFYFDPEKNRYFKIDGEHSAGTSRSTNADDQTTATPRVRHVQNIARVLREKQIATKTRQQSLLSHGALENRLSLVVDIKTVFEPYLHDVRSEDDYGLRILDMQPAPDFSGALINGGGVLHYAAADFGEGIYDQSRLLCKYERFLDFAFVIPKGQPPMYLATSTPSFNQSMVRLSPINRGDPGIWKRVSDVPLSCAWNPSAAGDAYAISYSAAAKTVLVKSIERHFGSRNRRKGSANNYVFSHNVTSQCFSPTSDQHFSGLANGTTEVVDWRCKKKEIIIGKVGNGRVRYLHVTRDARQLITRCIAEKDTITLRDIRKSSVPVFDYISIKGHGNETISSRRMSVFEDRILSCVAQDCNAYMWNVTTGKLFFKLEQSGVRPQQRLKYISFTDKHMGQVGAPSMYSCTEQFFGLFCLDQQDKYYDF